MSSITGYPCAIIIWSFILISMTKGSDAKPCSTTDYNPRTQKCCKGVVQEKPYGKPQCCGTVAYNTNNYMCCSGEVTPRPNSDNVECCGTLGYDKDTEICCRDTSTVFQIGESQQPGCCNGQFLDNAIQMCCEGVIVAKPDGLNVACCKFKPYNKDTHACIGDDIVSIEAECLAACYDVEREICCKGKIYDKSHRLQKCCGDKLYIPHDTTFADFGVCCENRFYGGILNEKGKCCGGHIYWDRLGHWYNDDASSADQICCGETIYYQNWYEVVCCGNDEYKPNLGDKCCDDRKAAFANFGTCCNGIMFNFNYYADDTYPLDHCCGEGVYDPERTLCCDGHIIELSRQAQGCCGANAFDPVTQVCCGSTAYSLPPSLSHIRDCCGEQLFDSNVQLCCNGTIYWKGQTNVQFQCCGTNPYKAEQICCGDELYKINSGYACCGKQYYDTSKMSCCYDQP